MSDMKCPFCDKKLEPCYGFGMELYSCSDLTCKGSYMQAEDSVWQELIRTRKALDFAVDALKRIKFRGEHSKYKCCKVSGIIAQDALGKIKAIPALEQKD